MICGDPGAHPTFMTIIRRAMAKQTTGDGASCGSGNNRIIESP